MKRRRLRYSEGSRGPLRHIVESYPESGEYTVELRCGHAVARRRVLEGQRTTNCEVCKAVASGMRRAA